MMNILFPDFFHHEEVYRGQRLLMMRKGRTRLYFNRPCFYAKKRYSPTGSGSFCCLYQASGNRRNNHQITPFLIPDVIIL